MGLNSAFLKAGGKQQWHMWCGNLANWLFIDRLPKPEMASFFQSWRKRKGDASPTPCLDPADAPCARLPWTSWGSSVGRVGGQGKHTLQCGDNSPQSKMGSQSECKPLIQCGWSSLPLVKKKKTLQNFWDLSAAHFSDLHVFSHCAS